MRPDWHGKPYYSLDAYCKNHLHHKAYKIALDAHMTCPNRDGTLGRRGCIFCSAGGSGEFAVPAGDTDINVQLEEGLKLLCGKQTGSSFIAYFQAFTNTYAPVSRLEKMYTQALDHPDVCGISIATRPDCMPEEVLELIAGLTRRYPDKFIWVELGLQTIHESTACFIRRGYPLSCFEQTSERLHACNIPFIVHVILGLPGETPQDMYDTIRYLNVRRPFGVKLQLMHVLKGTDLADYYLAGGFETLSMESYLDILIHALELLDPGTVVHRVTGDGPKSLTIAPLWSLNKRKVLNCLHHLMNERGAYQGRLFHENAAAMSGPPSLTK